MVLVTPYELPRRSDKLPIAACQLPIAALSCLKLPMAAFAPCASVALHVLIADMFIGSFFSFMCHNSLLTCLSYYVYDLFLLIALLFLYFLLSYLLMILLVHDK